MHTAAPAKRRRPNNVTTNYGNHPFENLMNMIGTTFHRQSRQQRQSQQHMQQHESRSQQQTRQSNASSHREQAAPQPTHRPEQRSSMSRHPAYMPPSSYNGTKDTAAKNPTLQSSSQSSSRSSASSAAAWRTAVCPRTQKTYYWNVHTRESRWKKPLELASEEEREAIRSKERKQREFFESMERNILRRLEGGKKAAVGAEGGVEGSAKNVAARPNRIDKPKNVSANPTTAGIEQSWMRSASNSSNDSNTDSFSDDWINGWITPGSDVNNSQRAHSPSGSLSLSSMEGLSVLDPNSTSSLSPGNLSISATTVTSLGSLSREERDDKISALHRPQMSKLQRIKSSSSRPVIDKPDLIRTISKMEYDLVHQLNPSLRSTKVQDTTPRTFQARTKRLDDEPRTPTDSACDILSSLHLALDSTGINVSLLNATASTAVPITPTSPLTPMSQDDSDLNTRTMSSPNSIATEIRARDDLAKPNLQKRNTCSTIYLGSTLSAPDKDALIKCVCGVFRAHLLQTESVPVLTPSNPDAIIVNETFHDRRAPGDYRHLDTSSIPSLSQITDFYRSIFLRSQMEVDCIIISLIYVERLIKKTHGSLTPRATNWRSILFSCMVLASKVWDDLSMWNCDFSKIGPSGMTFSLARTNELEVALLRALEYKVKVNASEYAKYYFLLRGMLCRSGLANDDLTRLRPLDIKGAQTLETGTTGDKSKSVAKVPMKERSKSYGFAEKTTEMNVDSRGLMSSEDASMKSAALPPQSSPSSQRVSLEQIVRM